MNFINELEDMKNTANSEMISVVAAFNETQDELIYLREEKLQDIDRNHSTIPIITENCDLKANISICLKNEVTDKKVFIHADIRAKIKECFNTELDMLNSTIISNHQVCTKISNVL